MISPLGHIHELFAILSKSEGCSRIDFSRILDIDKSSYLPALAKELLLFATKTCQTYFGILSDFYLSSLYLVLIILLVFSVGMATATP